MCIITWSTQPNDQWKLILIANRDESYLRPTANSHFWKDKNIIASKDLLHQGTQFAIDLKGRMAILTNLVTDHNDNPNLLSRGLLTVNYFVHNDMKQYVDSINDNNYMPYNLLLGELKESNYVMNYSRYNGEKNSFLDSGKVYVLENKSLNDHVERAEITKQMFEQIVMQNFECDVLIKQLFDLLTNKNVFRYYQDKNFGTRTQTIILINKNNKVTMIERSLLLESLQIIDKIALINNEKGHWIENRYEYFII